MEATQEMLTIDELKLNSFVTTLDHEEQLAIQGGCWSPASWIIGGLVYDGVKWAVGEMVESTSNMPTTTETSPGFFDTSYPCESMQ